MTQYTFRTDAEIGSGDFMPKNMIIDVYPNIGKIIFRGTDDDIVYLALYRDPKLTDMMHKKNSSEVEDDVEETSSSDESPQD